jgi:two-component system, chemotaxis family, chemotaxis protein CheY
VGRHCRFCNEPATLPREPVDFFRTLAPGLGENRGAQPQEKNLSSANSNVVLVVDDDPDILEALSEILEAEGFEIRRARNGKEALEKLEPEPPQLILLDLMMPVMDGWEFAQRMRQRPGVATIPIIVLSADRNVGSKATDIGAVGHLAKPFELNDLLEMVRRSLGQAQASTAR